MYIYITWKDRVSNDEIYRKSGLAPMTDILIERNLRWTGHVHRMDAERLPRQLLYSQLSSGARNQGRPRLRFKDVVKRNLKWRDVSLDTWQAGAREQPVWRTMIRRSKHRTVIVGPTDCSWYITYIQMHVYTYIHICNIYIYKYTHTYVCIYIHINPYIFSSLELLTRSPHMHMT